MDFVEDEHFDSVGAEYVGGNLRKLVGVVAGVEGDAYAEGAFHLLFQVVGEALGGHSHSVTVHAVGAYAHSAAEAACTEFEVAVECIFQCSGILCKLSDFFLGGFVEIAVKPRLCSEFKFFHNGYCFKYLIQNCLSLSHECFP